MKLDTLQLASGAPLDRDDPFLAVLRKHASRSPQAHAWLIDSARHWARLEFQRRWEKRGDFLYFEAAEQEVERLVLHQVAVLVRHAQPAYTAIHFDGAIENAWCGFLGERSTGTYMQLDRAAGRYTNGVFDILDIFELPREFRVKTWPVPVEQPTTTVQVDQNGNVMPQSFDSHYQAPPGGHLTVVRRQAMVMEAQRLQGGQLAMPRQFVNRFAT